MSKMKKIYESIILVLVVILIVISFAKYPSNEISKKDDQMNQKIQNCVDFNKQIYSNSGELLKKSFDTGIISLKFEDDTTSEDVKYALNILKLEPTQLYKDYNKLIYQRINVKVPEGEEIYTMCMLNERIKTSEIYPNKILYANLSSYGKSNIGKSRVEFTCAFFDIFGGVCPE